MYISTVSVYLHQSLLLGSSGSSRKGETEGNYIRLSTARERTPCVPKSLAFRPLTRERGIFIAVYFPLERPDLLVSLFYNVNRSHLQSGKDTTRFLRILPLVTFARISLSFRIYLSVVELYKLHTSVNES